MLLPSRGTVVVAHALLHCAACCVQLDAMLDRRLPAECMVPAPLGLLLRHRVLGGGAVHAEAERRHDLGSPQAVHAPRGDHRRRRRPCRQRHWRRRGPVEGPMTAAGERSDMSRHCCQLSCPDRTAPLHGLCATTECSHCCSDSSHLSVTPSPGRFLRRSASAAEQYRSGWLGTCTESVLESVLQQGRCRAVEALQQMETREAGCSAKRTPCYAYVQVFQPSSAGRAYSAAANSRTRRMSSDMP